MTAADRAARRHQREKATIDRLVKDTLRPQNNPAPPPQEDALTDTGLPVEDQVRKEWDPEKKGGLPVF